LPDNLPRRFCQAVAIVFARLLKWNRLTGDDEDVTHFAHGEFLMVAMYPIFGSCRTPCSVHKADMGL
jgi:hypothetical protein